jgi:hypothetical protein
MRNDGKIVDMVDISFLNMYFEQMTVLEDSEFLKISYIEKDSDYVVVSFSSTPPDDTEPHEQFITTLTDKRVTGIYVVDKTSSYGNKIDWQRIVNAVNGIANGRKVVAIGYCMGGTLAVALTKYMPVSYVLAITPQYSIHPYILPKDSFLNRWANQIDDWKMPSLEGFINNLTNYVIVSTNNYDDSFQDKLFPVQDNVRKIIFDTDRHDLPKVIGDDLEEFMFDLIKSNKIKKKFLPLIVE